MRKFRSATDDPIWLRLALSLTAIGFVALFLILPLLSCPAVYGSKVSVLALGLVWRLLSASEGKASGVCAGSNN